jgi:hypothetical protein
MGFPTADVTAMGVFQGAVEYHLPAQAGLVKLPGGIERPVLAALERDAVHTVEK